MMSRIARRRASGGATILAMRGASARVSAHLAREETREAPRLAVARRPAAGRRERDDRAGAAALGELQRQRAAHRVADDVRACRHPARRDGPPSESVEPAKLIGLPGGNGVPAVVSGERRRDHLVARDELAEQRAPMHAMRPVKPCSRTQRLA